MHHLHRNLFIVLISVLLAGLSTGCSKLRQERHTSRGDRYYAAGQYSKAEIEYLNVLKANRLNAHAITRLGLIYFDEGRVARSYPFLMKALELNPDNLQLRLKAGLLYLATGNAQKARQQAEAVLDKSPTNSQAPLLLVKSARTKQEADAIRRRLEKLQKQIGNTAPLEVALGTLDLRTGKLQPARAAFQKALGLDAQFAAAHSALGALYLAQNNLTNALAQFQTAADLSPLRSPLRLQYASTELKAGEITNAQATLSAITRKAPDYLPAWTGLAEIAFAQRRYTNCESLVKQALLRDPNDYHTLLLDARLKLAQGQNDKAIAQLEKAANLYPRSPMISYQLALAHLAKGEPGKASNELDHALTLDPTFDAAILLKAQLNIRKDNTDSAVAALRQLLQRQPRLPQASLLLVNAYVKRGSYGGALATCRKLSEYYPTNAQVPLLTGQIYLREKKPAEARKEFEKSLKLAPDFLQPLEQLVNLDLLDKHYDTAMKRIQAKQARWPKSPVLQVLRAQVFSAQNQTNRMEQALLQAIRLNPKYEPAYLLLAQVYASSKQNAKALAQLNDTLSKNPRDVTALMLKGMIENEEKHYDSARTTYEKLLAVNPKFSPALNNLAYLYSEQFNELDKAYEVARKARDLAPNNPYCGDTLGWILFKRHQYTWARSLLQQSAEQLSKEPEVQYHLGMVYYMTGDAQHAAETFKRALALNKEYATKSFPEKAEAERRLAILALDPRKAGAQALAELQQETQAHPDDPVAQAKLAEIYTRRGAARKAAAAYEAALEANTNNASVLIGYAALCADQLHDPQKGLGLARQAYKIAPGDPEVSYTLGRLVFAGGDQKWAVSLLQQSARKLPDNPELLYDLAIADYSLGQVSDAEATMRKALKIGGSFSRAKQARQFLDLAPLPAKPAKALAAVPEARGVLQTDPTNVPALMVVATADQRRGDAPKASAVYKTVLKRFPNFIPAIKQLAILEASQPGETQQAYDLAMKARQALPNDAAVAKTLGILSYRRKDYDAAAQLLAQSTQAGLTDATSLYYLGMAQYQLKEPAQSKAALQRALKLNLSQDLATKAKQVLAQIK